MCPWTHKSNCFSLVAWPPSAGLLESDQATPRVSVLLTVEESLNGNTYCWKFLQLQKLLPPAFDNSAKTLALVDLQS